MLIYYLVGFVGVLVLVLFMYGWVFVGVLGVMMGLIGVRFVEVVMNWNVFKYCICLIVFIFFFFVGIFVYGLLFFMDNFMYFGGFFIGLLFGNVLLI